MFGKYLSGIFTDSKGTKAKKKLKDELIASIEKISKVSGTFRGIKSDKILDGLASKRIRIFSLTPGEILINEGSKDCNSMYLLIRGEIGIYKNQTELTTISTLSIVGEVGFTNPEFCRTATVKVLKESFFLEITREFTEGLNPKEQIMIEKNLNRELSEKLNYMNSAIFGGGKKGKFGDNITNFVKDGITSIL